MVAGVAEQAAPAVGYALGVGDALGPPGEVGVGVALGVAGFGSPTAIELVGVGTGVGTGLGLGAADAATPDASRARFAATAVSARA